MYAVRKHYSKTQQLLLEIWALQAGEDMRWREDDGTITEVKCRNNDA